MVDAHTDARPRIMPDAASCPALQLRDPRSEEGQAMRLYFNTSYPCVMSPERMLASTSDIETRP